MSIKEGLLGRKYEYATATITLSSSGNGTVDVVFPSGFINAPDVMVVSQLGDSGTFGASSITKDGCTITVTSSTVVSSDISVIYIAHEKL